MEGGIARGHLRAVAAQTVEDGRRADQHEASTHQNVADEEDEDDEGVDRSEDRESQPNRPSPRSARCVEIGGMTSA